MLDSTIVAAWIGRLLDELKSSRFAELSLVILNGNTKPPAQPASRLRRLLAGQMRNALYSRYVAFDDSRHGPSVTALQPRDVADLLKGAPQLSVKSIRSKFVDRFEEADLQAIKEHDLDVILRFGFNILKGDILNSARHGVWSYHHGDNTEYRGGPALFWEMYERNPVSGTILQRLTETLDGGDVLYRSYSSTEDPIWLSANRRRTYWKATAYVVRCLRQLYLRRGEALPPEAQQQHRRRLYRTPTNIQMVPFLGRAALNVLSSKVTSKHWVEQWLIGYRPAQTDDGRVPTGADFLPIYPPSDRFYADPFPIRVGEKDYIFFEDLELRTGKGVISFVSFDEQGRPTPARLALSADIHLSYPFLFEWRGELYMIPETAADRRVTLYRATRFPDRWERVGNLLENLEAVDATLLEHQGRWYMFVNVSEYGGSTCDELFLFTSDTPLGPFLPHPLNPIKSDVRSARSAGRIFNRGGMLLRPAQDCSVTYGYAIQFCEITKLTEDDYEERLVGRIDPTWMKGLIGTHTFNSTDTLETIDGKRIIRIRQPIDP